MASIATVYPLARMVQQRRAGNVQMMGAGDVRLMGPLPQLLGPEAVQLMGPLPQLLGPSQVQLMSPLPQMVGAFGEITPEEALEQTVSAQKWSLAFQAITTVALASVALMSLYKVVKDH